MNTRLLLDHFPKTLTADQRRALVELDDFLHDDNAIFLLKGYAGTGKTFLLGGLVSYLKKRGIHFRLMAPTGRATRILHQKTRVETATIHRTIYALERTQELPPKNENDTVSFKHHFDLRANADFANTVYLIDEASMISDQADDETEFLRFGSGQLLHDLLVHINPHSAGLRRKIIFVGDPAQLPPVGSSHSPALDAGYLAKEYRLPVQEFTLTEVVRQKADGGILAAATTIRNAIRAQTFHTITVDNHSADITHIAPGKFLPAYLAASKEKINGSTILITYSNRTALEYNRQIRAHFFPNTPQICPGDKIIVVRNSYNVQRTLFNGEFGKVLNVSDRVETKPIPLKTKAGTIKVRLDFRDVVIRFWDTDGRGFNVPCKIIDSLLASPERSLTPEETRALYVDFRMRHPHLKPQTPDFQEALLGDPYFNALQIKFGYAITCHKAQGGEWPHVLVDFDIAQGQTNENYFRWAYTAITRAKEHLYAINAPYQTAFSTMSIAELPVERSHSPQMDEEAIRTDIRRRVETVLQGTDIHINAKQHHSYQEVYTFVHHNQHCTVDIWFKKTGQISRVLPRQKDSDLAKILIERLTALAKPKSPAPQSKSTTSSAPPDLLQQLRHRIETVIATRDIKITRVKSHNFQESYFFQKDGQLVQFDFFYNGKGQFTTIQPHRSAANYPELLSELTELLRTLRKPGY